MKSLRFLTVGLLCSMCLLAVTAAAEPEGCHQFKGWITPTLNQPLQPDHATPGSGDLQLTLNGTGFDWSTDVLWNGTNMNTPGGTHYSQMVVTIPASLLKVAGTATVMADYVLPSNPQYFYISSPRRDISNSNWGRKDYAIGIQPERQVVADINNDGNLDIISVDGPGNAVIVALGKSNGTFQTPVSYPAGNDPSALIVADFNADFVLDVATANYNDGTVSIFFGNGNGTLQSHVDYRVGRGPIALVAGDFQCEAVQNLAVVNSLDNTVSVLSNNSDGTFTPMGPLATGPNPSAIALGDFNADGYLDLAVTNFGNYTGNTVSLFFGVNGGLFQAKVDLPTDAGPQSVIASDLNGDGILDLATANACGHAATCGRPGTVSVLIGNGNGTFKPAVNYDAGSYPFTVVAANLRGVNALDLAVTDLDSGFLDILLGKGDGTFPSSTLIKTNGRPVGLVAGDVNHDGKPDLIVGGTNPPGFTVMTQR